MPRHKHQSTGPAQGGILKLVEHSKFETNGKLLKRFPLHRLWVHTVRPLRGCKPVAVPIHAVELHRGVWLQNAPQRHLAVRTVGRHQAYPLARGLHTLCM
eukprot:2350121-Amphidinium_carterae.2